MCGRISNDKKSIQEIESELGAIADVKLVEAWKPRWNIGPMQLSPILRLRGGDRWLEEARWGCERIVGLKRDGTRKVSHPFNTLAETASRKPAWRSAWQDHRCVVPATGFYEWSGPRSDRRPVHFTRRDGGLLLLAGIFDEPAAPDGSRSFSVLTTTPNRLLAEIHDRMPVILEPDEVERWLRAPHPDLMRPMAEALLIAAPASKLVNSVANEGPQLLQPGP